MVNIFIVLEFAGFCSQTLFCEKRNITKSFLVKALVNTTMLKVTSTQLSRCFYEEPCPFET